MKLITGGGVFTKGNIAAINGNFAQLFGGFTPGNTLYCNPSATGASAQDGSSGSPYNTLAGAYSNARAGMNDVIVLVGNGLLSGTARIDASFTWAKDATHLIGVSAPSLLSQRSRLAPTPATTAFTPFFTISGSGCIFQNIQWFHGFTTGGAAQVNVVVTGERNVFQNCHFAGMGDAASAVDAGSRSLVIGAAGSGENLFDSCTIGIDTGTKRTGANASLEFAGATVRNVFRNCLFPFWCSAATPLGILGTGNECVDRFQLFDNCSFINATGSTSTTMTVLGSFTTASPGGILLYKQCILIAIGEYGDTNALANSYIDGFTGIAGTSGIAVKPT